MTIEPREEIVLASDAAHDHQEGKGTATAIENETEGTEVESVIIAAGEMTLETGVGAARAPPTRGVMATVAQNEIQRKGYRHTRQSMVVASC